MQYVKRPEKIQATQWFENGDHPGDGKERFTEGEFKGELLEGKVVRRFRLPEQRPGEICPQCSLLYHNHGWIDSGGAGQTVCPGDYIITNADGTYTVMKPDQFVQTYAKFSG